MWIKLLPCGQVVGSYPKAGLLKCSVLQGLVETRGQCVEHVGSIFPSKTDKHSRVPHCPPVNG